jgi:hypothetical protein
MGTAPRVTLSTRAHARRVVRSYGAGMTSNVVPRPRRAPWTQVLGGTAVGVLSAAAWAGWMGWDEQYQIDPVTQVASGPYEAWQVVGCVVSLLVVLVGALTAGVHPLVASPAMTVAFTAAWTATAAPRDDTGMYGVGMVLLFIGLAAGTAIVSVVFVALRGALRRR